MASSPQLPMARTFTLSCAFKNGFQRHRHKLVIIYYNNVHVKTSVQSGFVSAQTEKMRNPLLPDVMFMFPFKEAARSRILASPMPLFVYLFGTASVVCDTKLIKSRVFTNDYFMLSPSLCFAVLESASFITPIKQSFTSRDILSEKS